MKEVSQKVVVFLVILYLFVLIIQLTNLTILTGRITQVTGRGTQGTVTLTITPSVLQAPLIIQSQLAVDNQSIYVNWSQVSGVSMFMIYYSDNLTQMRTLDPLNPGTQIINFTAFGQNWTDTNATDNLTRFYRVGSKRNADINLSTTILGKQTHEFIASVDGSLRNNLFGMVYNNRFNFSKYLNELCLEVPRICDAGLGIPTIQAIDRSDPEAQPFVTHPYGFVAGASYEMRNGTGYKILVNESYNKSETGKLADYIIVNLTASTDGNIRNNYFTDNYIENETFSQYLGIICAQEPQICDAGLGIPTIQAIDRSNPEAQPFVTHPYGFVAGANYKMKSGAGYKILVNESIILVLNNTI